MGGSQETTHLDLGRVAGDALGIECNNRVLEYVAVPISTFIPAPDPALLTRLRAIVSFTAESAPPSTKMPPPLVAALLTASVRIAETVRAARSVTSIPPPTPAAVSSGKRTASDRQRTAGDEHAAAKPGFVMRKRAGADSECTAGLVDRTSTVVCMSLVRPQPSRICTSP